MAFIRIPSTTALRNRPVFRRGPGLLSRGLAAMILLGPAALSAKVATWTGDPWGEMTRAQMVENADLMINSTWTPRRTIHNYRSPTQPRTRFDQGVTYRGVAYNMIHAADDWAGFLGKVNNTPGGETSYGNDCSAFISIVWQLPRRLNTVRFEEEVTGPAELAHSLGPIGSGASVALVQGDVLNRSGNHNILFDRYSANGVVSAEQTPGPRATSLPHPEMRRNWSWSSLEHYRPIRRNLITEVNVPPDYLPGDWARTTPPNLNFRSGPGTSHAIIARLPEGTLLRILDHSEGGVRLGGHHWWHVEFFGDGRIGWVAGGFLDPASAPSDDGWPDVVVTTAHPEFTASGHWQLLPSSPNGYSSHHRRRGTATIYDPAEWKAYLPYPGEYRVLAWWDLAEGAATQATYLVNHAGGTAPVVRDQSQNGGQWNELGVFSFEDGPASVRLLCWTSSGSVVVADAVRFVALDEPPEPDTFAHWRRETFGPDDPPGTSARGPFGDPFGQGVTNLTAFAFGMDPRAPDRSLLPRIFHNGETAMLEFRRRNGASGVHYRVEQSEDLRQWTEWVSPYGELLPAALDVHGMETIRVTLPSEIPNQALFYRLVVTDENGN